MPRKRISAKDPKFASCGMTGFEMQELKGVANANDRLTGI
jgi:hypothetical protein